MGDWVYILNHKYLLNNYCTISTCSLSALLLEPQSSSINQPLIWHKVHPLCDLYHPCLTNFNGNLVAVGGEVTVNTYSDIDGRDCEQYSVLPKLYAHSDKLDGEGWNFVANLPIKGGYPDSDFLVATIQGHQLIVYVVVVTLKLSVIYALMLIMMFLLMQLILCTWVFLIRR